MAELAAASGAAGLVSLGLQACSGLMQYCNGWKNFDKDNAAISLRIKGLERALEVLNTLFSRPRLPELVPLKLVNESVLDCAEGITQLEALHKKCTEQTLTANPTRRLVLKQMQRGLYPFRKSDVESLNTILNQLQNNLNTAMHIAHL